VRTLVHLSDLHFDRVDRDVVEALAVAVGQARPDVVAVSGDLTQRARAGQFRRARAFLDRLPRPHVVVPGNHDVPLFNVIARAWAPLGGYTRHVTTDLRPRYEDETVLVLGVDTTHSLTTKGGRIRDLDVEHILHSVNSAGQGKVRIVVCHHPIDGTVGALASGGVDLFLTGHLHVSSTAHTAERFAGAGFSAVVVEGGTATSTRMRGEGNAFNILKIDTAAIVVEHFEWRPALHRFDQLEVQRFVRTPAGWFPA
jgi:3',5'-cyclic AMP phosphodiesterase CpdA